jgi:hypothetical protein
MPTKQLSGSQWKARITFEREKLLTLKFKNAPDDGCKKPRTKVPGPVTGATLLVSMHFTKYYKAKMKSAQKIIDKTSSDFMTVSLQCTLQPSVRSQCTQTWLKQEANLLGQIFGGSLPIFPALNSLPHRQIFPPSPRPPKKHPRCQESTLGISHQLKRLRAPAQKKPFSFPVP